MNPYPPPSRRPYPAAVLSKEGALLEASLKWDRAKAWPGRGNPSRPDAAPEVVPRKHGLGRLWVSVRAHYRALPLAWLDGDRRRRETAVQPRPPENGRGL